MKNLNFIETEHKYSKNKCGSLIFGTNVPAYKNVTTSFEGLLILFSSLLN